MGTNSIKSNLTKETIISEIKLLSGTKNNEDKVYIIVEGEDDIKFLKKFLKANVIIYESFSGKKGVEEIINSKEIHNSRVIGIIDRDYSEKSKDNRIFFYDRCCMEMMLIGFDEVFECIYHEFYNGEIEVKKLRNHILKELYKLSRIRKYNEKYIKGINFKGLSFNNIINYENKIDEEKFIESIRKINPNKSLDFIEKIEKLNNIEIDELLNITNGHDFIYFFKALCNKTIKNKGIKYKEISSVLRGVFNNQLLKSTKLYLNINNYFENKNTIWNFDK